MFIGHFGAGFGAKSVAPAISLGTLFLAAQFIDLLWPTLLLLGLEHVSIVPGATAVTPLVFDHYPISHSLLAVAGWGLLIGAVYFLLRKNSKGAIVLGLLVLSHWVLDLIVHQPDLPIYPGSMLLGMNVWSSLVLTLILELGLLGAGVWMYVRSTRALDAQGRWGLWGLVAFLLLIHFGNMFGD